MSYLIILPHFTHYILVEYIMKKKVTRFFFFRIFVPGNSMNFKQTSAQAKNSLQANKLKPTTNGKRPPNWEAVFVNTHFLTTYLWARSLCSLQHYWTNTCSSEREKTVWVSTELTSLITRTHKIMILLGDTFPSSSKQCFGRGGGEGSRAGQMEIKTQSISPANSLGPPRNTHDRGIYGTVRNHRVNIQKRKRWYPETRF